MVFDLLLRLPLELRDYIYQLLNNCNHTRGTTFLSGYYCLRLAPLDVVQDFLVLNQYSHYVTIGFAGRKVYLVGNQEFEQKGIGCIDNAYAELHWTDYVQLTQCASSDVVFWETYQLNVTQLLESKEFVEYIVPKIRMMCLYCTAGLYMLDSKFCNLRDVEFMLPDWATTELFQGTLTCSPPKVIDNKAWGWVKSLQFSDLPKTMFYILPLFVNLKHICIHQIECSDVGEFLKLLPPELEELEMDYFPVEYAYELLRFKCLKSLVLRNSEFRSLFELSAVLPIGLQVLKLPRNTILEMEHSMLSSSLKVLDLSRNAITNLQLGMISSTITHLNISQNPITILPRELGLLENLVILDLSFLYLSHIDCNFSNLKNLTKLRLSGSYIPSLECFGQLPSLEELVLDGLTTKTQLQFSPSLKQSLRTLSLSYIHCSHIELLDDFFLLNKLDVSGCCLTETGQLLGSNMPSLVHLEMNLNYINDISILTNYPCLEELHLDSNLLNEDTFSAICLPKLRLFYAATNNISTFIWPTLPRNLEFIDLTNNPALTKNDLLAALAGLERLHTIKV